MRPISQEHNFGCGAACVAFVLKKNYSEVIHVLGKVKAKSKGFYCKDIIKVLAKFGLVYSYKYLKPKLKRKIYKSGIIVFIKRSRRYPTGHYLVRYEGLWMDPWINYQENRSIQGAESGFRKKLPGIPIYGLFPENGF